MCGSAIVLLFSLVARAVSPVLDRLSSLRFGYNVVPCFHPIPVCHNAQLPSVTKLTSLGASQNLVSSLFLYASAHILDFIPMCSKITVTVPYWFVNFNDTGSRNSACCRVHNSRDGESCSWLSDYRGRYHLAQVHVLFHQAWLNTSILITIVPAINNNNN